MKDIYNVQSIYEMYKIIKANYKFDIGDFKITKTETSIFNDFNKELLESSGKYLNYEFAYEYLEKCNNCYQITYKELNMFVIMRNKITKKEKMQVFKNLYRLHLISKIYNISKWGNYKFNFYIIMNPLKRCFPSKKDDIIDVKHINGGFTYINRNDIYIIRKEDYEKVLLHELLHHNILINKQDWLEINIKRLRDHFNIHDSMLLLPNEAIIETYACVLNTIFYSIETGTSLKNNLKKDQEHSIQLANKILEKQGGKKWYEKTHSYCYIVFKTILYVYFNNFLKINIYNNDTAITDFLIKYSPQIYKRMRSIRDVDDTNKGRNIGNKLKQTIY
jgi:hypothetical protein